MQRHHAILRAQAGAIGRRQLRDAGVSAKRVASLVRAGDLLAVRDDVLVAAAAPPTWNQRAWVHLLDAAPGARLSHRTAARLHRVGRIVTTDIDVLEVEEQYHRDRRRGVHRTTWLPAHHGSMVEGLPVTSLGRTLFDLASLVSPARRRRGLPHLTEQQVARALDDALVRRLTVGAMQRVLAELGGRGRPGTRVLRGLLELRGEGYVATESELEDLLLAVLAAHGMPRPAVQRMLGHDAPAGRVDAVYLDLGIVIEADGRRHHTALLDAESDRWRDLELSSAGFVVIRVTWDQLVGEPQRFVAGLRRLIEVRTRANRS